MEILKITLMLAVILVSLFYILNYFGFLVIKSGICLFSAHYSFPTRWEGKYSEMSGFLRRNFVVFKNYSVLSIEAETNSGTLGFEINAPDGSSLSPISSVYGQDTSVLIDLSCLKRCSVTLQMEHFNGQFRIALQ